jgi:hypothetical protein
MFSPVVCACEGRPLPWPMWVAAVSSLPEVASDSVLSSSLLELLSPAAVSADSVHSSPSVVLVRA